jgi:predicted transposase/invertase (TIGR01784 family)
VIAVHQLPETPETLWLRLLGRDNVQKRAISELMTLPQTHPYRQLSLRHIAVLQKNLQARQNLSKDLREVAMNLAVTYEQIEAELIQKGIEQGKAQESRKIALELLREGMSPEKVARLTELPIDHLPRLED